MKPRIESIKPPSKDSPAWEQWALDHPLHRAVAGKASKEVTDQRINQICLWVADGHGRLSVLQHASAQWGLTHRQIETLRARAYEQLKQQYELDRKDYAVQLISQMETVVEQSINDRQYGAAVGAAVQLMKITGLSGK